MDQPASQVPSPKAAPPKPKKGVVALLLIGLASTCCLCMPVSVVGLIYRSMRDQANEIHSSNNLKQIGLATLMYVQVHGSFPPAHTIDENGARLASWRTLILPYMEQANLFNAFDLSQPWDSAPNEPVSRTRLKVFESPRESHDKSTTNYVVVEGADTLFPGSSGVRRHQVRDGLSHTLLAVEIANSDIHWAEPRDLELQQLRIHEQPPPGEKNVVVRGAAMVRADGSVFILDESLTDDALRRLATIADGQAAEDGTPP